MHFGKFDRQTLAIIGVCVLGVLLLGLVTLSSEQTSTEEIVILENDSVVASVNGHPIYEQDLTLAIARSFEQATPPEKAEILQNLIDQHLLASKARTEGLDKNAAVKAQLRKSQDEILAAALIEQSVENAVTEDRLKKLYDSQSQIRQRGIEVRARQILLPDLETAEEVIKKLAGDDSFQSLAFAYSLDRVSRESGGDLGYFTRDSYPPEFADPVFEMTVGSRSDPFQTERGWHIVEVSDRRQAPSPTFEAMKDDLATFLRAKTIEDLMTDLRDGAEIEILTETSNIGGH